MRSACKFLPLLLLFSYQAEAAITPVGADEDFLADAATGNMTLTLPAHETNDFGLICVHEAETGTLPDHAVAVATGWSELRTDNGDSGSDRQTTVFYKKFTSNSETNPQISSTIELDRMAVISVWRGVDTTTAFDATEQFDNAQGGASTTEDPTNPAITTVTDNAFVVICATAAQGNSMVIGAPTSYTLADAVDVSDVGAGNDAIGGMAYIDSGALGAETPGAWINSLASSTPDWNEYTFALRPAAAAPAFDSGPTKGTCTDTGCPFDYDGGALADEIHAMFLSTAESAPTCAAIEAETGSNGAAGEAVTGAADTITLTSTDAPEFPLYNAHFCLEEGTSNYSAVSTVSAAALADPTGEQFIAITSIGAASPCASFNTAVNPDIANGDYLLANDNVDPGAVAVTISAACQYSYSASGRQSVLNTEVYDASVGAYHASDIDAWFNNSAPVCIDIPDVFVWTKDVAITAFDLDTYCTDADTEQSVYTVTTGTLPTGVTLTGATGAISGTPTVEDEDGVAITFTATDIPGDTDTFTSTMYVIDTVTMPDISSSDLNTAIADMASLRPWLDVGEGVSATFACDVEVLDQIVSQDPAATTEITSDEEVSVVVSLGSCTDRKETEMRLRGIRIGL